jgi:hypothetical protein
MQRFLDRPQVVYLASALTLAIGLFFIFVWAPHPWGWAGIDFYHQLAMELARGQEFTTTDVPWGYAYFVALTYRLFGEAAWVPLVIQAIANAFVPVMLYRLARPLTSHRTAALSALLIGVFSFNTVYVSTQASDSMCTVLFMASLLCFAQGHRHDSTWYFAASGLLAGLVPQFRPNMILLPLVMAPLYAALPARSWRKTGRMALYLALVAAVLLPWIVRNYRLTGAVIPTSTHGGEQLWYGTLQVGPYLEDRTHNPRKVFESPPFDYTSLAGSTIVVSVDYQPCPSMPAAPLELVYWTDRDPGRRRLTAVTAAGSATSFEIPGQPDSTAVYYALEAGSASWPAAGAVRSLAYFVSRDHLGDLDRHHDWLDVFDLVRMIRHIAWAEPLSTTPNLDFDADRRVSAADVLAAVRVLMPEAFRGGSPSLAVGNSESVLRLPDGSTLGVPRSFDGRYTSLNVTGEDAASLISSRRPMAGIRETATRRPDECLFTDSVQLNEVYYRREPHWLNRYAALAFDNIRRDPVAFALASAYRVLRLFVIAGPGDVSKAQQFSTATVVYSAALVASLTYFLVFLSGVVLAIRQRSALLWFLVPIAYVPLTIAFVLTNMRYTITVQPLMFAFVAVALMAALRLDDPRQKAEGTRQNARG